MTTTDELREAVARVLENISIDDVGDEDGWGAPYITPETAHETADRIIRMVVDACARELEKHDDGSTEDSCVTASVLADALRALAPKEPAP